jgi:hypothetical protein
MELTTATAAHLEQVRAGTRRALGVIDALVGEDVWLPLRLVVAPHAGQFRPHAEQSRAIIDEADGGPKLVDEGQVIGEVVTLHDVTAIASPVAGELGGLLAFPGERVIQHQPLAWVCLPAGEPEGAGRAADLIEAVAVGKPLDAADPPAPGVPAPEGDPR